MERIAIGPVRKLLETAAKQNAPGERWERGDFIIQEPLRDTHPIFPVSRALAAAASDWRTGKLCRNWASVFKQYQSPDGFWRYGETPPNFQGRYRESDYLIADTCHAVKTLNLLNARPRYPIRLPGEVMTPEGVSRYLDGVQWETQWGTSIPPGNLGMCFTANGMRELENAWFSWMDDHQDPETGWWLPDRARGEHVIGGAYHIMEGYICARRGVPYPEPLLKTLMTLYKEKACYPPEGKRPSCGGLDIAVMLIFLSRQLGLGGIRRAEIEKAVYDYLRLYYDTHVMTPSIRDNLPGDYAGGIGPLAISMAIGNEFLPEWFTDNRFWWYNWADRGLSVFPAPEGEG